MKKILLIHLILFIGICKAQQAVVTTGGSLSGVGGNASFSVGQVVYTTISGSNGSAAQGVQQNFCQTLYIDNDGDGYTNGTVVNCTGSIPVGFTLVSLGSDCMDNNPAVNPGAIEICYDGLDNDCNGIIDDTCVPILTKVQNSQCGANLIALAQTIFADQVTIATGYRFKVTKVISGFPSTNPIDIQSIDKPSRFFKITDLPLFAYNTTYQVEVAIKIGTVWQPFYGIPCNVTTPNASTKVITSQCNTTLNQMSDDVYADQVANVIGYRFRITNTNTLVSQITDKTLRVFKMTTLTSPAIDYSTTYNVEVALKNYDGTYTAFGPLCTITTPSLPTTQIQLSQCGITAVSGTQIIYANAVTGAVTYRFRLTNNSLFYSSTVDNPLRTFTLNQFSGLLTNTTYNVEVSVKIGNTFGAYGPLCTITTPGVFKSVSEAQLGLFSAIANPNPYDDTFQLELKTNSIEPIQIKIYDMLGKLIESDTVSVNELPAYTTGEKWASGVYNLVITQGEQLETLRVIKR